MTELDYMPEYKKAPMWDQLGKIIDSESARDVVPEHMFKPMTKVVTDDGVEFNLDHIKAQMIKDVVVQYPTVMRKRVLDFIQTSEGFAKILEAV